MGGWEKNEKKEIHRRECLGQENNPHTGGKRVFFHTRKVRGLYRKRG